MKKRIALLLLVFCLLLCACGTEHTPDPAPPAPEVSVPETPEPEPELEPEAEPVSSQLSQREQDWREDIEYLREQYKLRHIDPFYFVSEEEFDWKLDQVIGKIEDLSDNDLFYELAAVIAGMGDTHAYGILPDSFSDRRFPVGIISIGNQFYLYGCMEGYEQFAPYLLREVVAVNGIDIEYLQKKAESILSPSNTWSSKELFPLLYFYPSFLDWAGCDYTEGYSFQILNENREVESVEVPVLSGEYEETQIFPEKLRLLPWLLSRPENGAEYLEGENGGCVYMTLSDLSSSLALPYKEIFAETADLIETHANCSKLVIDLRRNPGGVSAALANIYIYCDMLQSPTI